MLETIVKIWDLILHSNLFNFVLMLLFLAWVFKKCDLSGKLELGRKAIEDKILMSKLAKENAIKDLFDVQSDAEKVDDEALKILSRAEENASILGEKLVSDAKVQALEIENSIKKTIEATAKSLNIKLTKNVSDAVVKLTKKHLENELKADKNLHMKFIEDSIQALNGVDL